MRFFYLLVSSVVWVSPALAQTVLLRPSPRALSTTQAPAATAGWRVDNFGFFSIVIDEKHNGYRYPTYENVNSPGYFSAEPHNLAIGDFNGDGWQDAAIAWGIFPHATEHKADLTLTMLMNDGQGRLVRRDDVWAGAAPKRRFLVYRTKVADFNGDGRSDFVVATGGLIERISPTEYRNTNEPIILALSRPDGKLDDASTRIEGQENGGAVPGMDFCHDMAVGDIDGDGDIDIMTAKNLFLNDGRGSFTLGTAQLHPLAKPGATFVMASAMGDFNDDGVADYVVCYNQDGARRPLAYLFLSKKGSRSISDRDVVELPDNVFGPFGARQNDLTVADVSGDGRLDLVFGCTRVAPYYQGRAVRLWINKGNGVFADETDARLNDPRKDYFITNGVGLGEGNLHVVDVNRDGFPDIVDSGSAEAGTGAGADGQPGMHVFLNRGNGTFALMPRTALPWVAPWQMAGYEHLRRFQENPLMQSYPIDLDGTGNMEFISFVHTPLSAFPQTEPNELSFYLLRGSTTREQPVVLDSSLGNLSVRTFAGSGDKTLIAGFVVDGGSKQVLVRGIGPALAGFGVPGTLTDPMLELSGGSSVIRNDNWETGTASAAVFSSLGAFPLASATKDAALFESISGGRSAIITGADGGTGVALVELYAAAGQGRLVNVSARTEVGTGANQLFAGFNIAGNTPRRLLIRAVGPTLANFGVAGVLADPVLSVRNSAGVEVAANDNWSTAANRDSLATSASRVGAFALLPGSKDAVVAATLPPGGYTATISGANETTGVALVEVYELP